MGTFRAGLEQEEEFATQRIREGRVWDMVQGGDSPWAAVARSGGWVMRLERWQPLWTPGSELWLYLGSSGGCISEALS